MANKKTLWTLGAIALLLTVGGAFAANRLLADDGEDRLDVALAAGGGHDVAASSASPVTVVEADYELRNVGASTARVTLTLTAPDGAVLDTRSETVAAGKTLEIEVGRTFGATPGAAGTYAAHLAVESGTVHVTEGGVDINEDEDGEDDR